MKIINPILTIKNNILGLLLLAIPLFSLIITQCHFFLKGHITPYNLPFAIGVVYILFIIFCKKNKINYSQVLVYILISLLIFLFSYFICIYFYDYSFDGQWYHQTIIGNLIYKWNPIYNLSCPTQDATGLIYVEHYAKGYEIIAATIASSFNNIEAGKIVNLLIISSSLFYCIHFWELYLPKMTKRKKIFYSIIITISPIISSQILTFYIDWALYSFIIIAISTIYHIDKQQSIDLFSYLTIFNIISMSLCFKFTFIFWISIFLFIYGIRLLIKKRIKPLCYGISITLFSVLFGIFFVSFNPYITNIINGYHFLYPLLGHDSVDIITNNTPSTLSSFKLPIMISASLFSRPSQTELSPWLGNFSFTISMWIIIFLLISIIKKVQQTKLNFYINIFGCLFIITIPFFIVFYFGNHDKYISIYKIFYQAGSFTDNRIGGFGALFIEALVLSIIYIVYAYKKNAYYFRSIGVMFFLYFSLFLLPASWWARYVPFFYLFVCIPIVYIEKYRPEHRHIRIVLTALLFINTYSVLYFAINKSMSHTKYEKECIKKMQEKAPIGIMKGTHNQGFIHKLREQNINYYMCDTASYKLELSPYVLVKLEDYNK